MISSKWPIHCQNIVLSVIHDNSFEAPEQEIFHMDLKDIRKTDQLTRKAYNSYFESSVLMCHHLKA